MTDDLRRPFDARFLIRQAYLVLADGTVLTGVGFGHRGTTIGEVVFNTGMTGYQEVLTDPSYAGQLVSFTYPELGNTGVNADDQRPIAPMRGVIARQLAPLPSNWRCEQPLETWMQTHELVGISGLDTRALVRHLREVGAMNGVISSDGQTLRSYGAPQAGAVDAGAEPGGSRQHREPYQWNQASVLASISACSAAVTHPCASLPSISASSAPSSIALLLTDATSLFCLQTATWPRCVPIGPRASFYPMVLAIRRR